MIPRLYLTAPLAEDAEAQADQRSRHHLVNVLRRGVGDSCVVFNGSDGEFDATIEQIGRNALSLRLGKQRRRQDAVPDLWLCFAPLKKDAVDFLVEKGTELGVARFQPILTRRSAVTRINAERMAANAIEAAEQTERLSVPEIGDLLQLDRLLADWPADRRLILCAEAGPALPLAQALAGLTPDVTKRNAWAIMCGPEGGFAPSELDRLGKLPFVTPVGLGPRILRAETAALAALAVFQALLGDVGRRPPKPLDPLSGTGSDA